MSPPGFTIGTIGAIGDGTIGAIGEVLSDYRRLSEYYRSSLLDYRTGAQEQRRLVQRRFVSTSLAEVQPAVDTAVAQRCAWCGAPSSIRPLSVIR